MLLKRSPHHGDKTEHFFIISLTVEGSRGADPLVVYIASLCEPCQSHASPRKLRVEPGLF